MGKCVRMTLATEDLGEIRNVNAERLDEVLESDGFGKFAILSTSEEAFIQAGSDWQPTAECEAFVDAHGSDPWVLEYCEGGHQFRAAGHATLDQVRQAFRSYLTGGSEWRDGFVWGELEL